jgi:hypothetical protein
MGDSEMKLISTWQKACQAIEKEWSHGVMEYRSNGGWGGARQAFDGNEEFAGF